MIALILLLVIVGVCLYFLEQLPMDPTIKTVIRVVVIICVVLYLLQAFGVMDLPVPKLRR